jgi:antitoxin component of MazEF toxin-antitoxin module
VFEAVVRKTGNSLMVTIPKDEAERLGLREGHRVEVEALRVESVPVLPPDEQALLDEILARPGMREALARASAWEREHLGERRPSDTTGEAGLGESGGASRSRG